MLIMWYRFNKSTHFLWSKNDITFPYQPYYLKTPINHK